MIRRHLSSSSETTVRERFPTWVECNYYPRASNIDSTNLKAETGRKGQWKESASHQVFHSLFKIVLNLCKPSRSQASDDSHLRLAQ